MPQITVEAEVWVSDVIHEIDDDELLEEVESRGLLEEVKNNIPQPLVKETPLNDIKIMLCDNFALSHVTEWDIIIERLKKELK